MVDAQTRVIVSFICTPFVFDSDAISEVPCHSSIFCDDC